MNGPFIAAMAALVTGINVYRSCTYHQGILRKALTIDVVGAVVFIGGCWLMGAFT